MVISRLFRSSVLAVAALSVSALTPAADATPAHRTLPAHVFSPYFQSYNPGDPATQALESGARFVNMAFLQTEVTGSCDVLWNGDPKTPVSYGFYGESINRLRAHGGDVAIAFGGGSASGLNTDIADSCTDVDKIAAEFQRVVTTYDITRIDLDVEGGMLKKPEGVDRRNKAIAKLQTWAHRAGRPLEVVYTLPAGPKGLEQESIDLLANAITNNTKVDIVNIMTFDYWDGKHHDMTADTMTAAQGLVDTLRTLYPQRTQRQLWNMVGVTEMIGMDDYGCCGETGPPEIFTPLDSLKVTAWAWRKGIAELSFWALGRDNGNCPGQHSGDCSGVEQTQWQYSRTMSLFTHTW
ncbi:chitinase [Actinocrispum sp. NPDC049592]|uniref:chitinase n=1 Tax=Actinocrispum sp. NPDC049592 TaxID=3154835 RepID=UPI003438366A